MKIKIYGKWLIITGFAAILFLLSSLTNNGSILSWSFGSNTSPKKYYNKSSSGLRMRSEPNAKAEMVVLIPYASEVFSIEQTKAYETIDGIYAPWHKVSFKDSTGKEHIGWVFGGFLSDTNAYAVDVQILMVGQYHGDEIKVMSGETWFGLYQTRDGFRLVETKITVEHVHDIIVDQSESQKTGLSITVDQPMNPIFLVKGVPNLKNRSVNTVFSGKLFVQPNEEQLLYFQLSEFDRYTLEAAAKKRISELLKYDDYNLTLVHSYLPLNNKNVHRTQALLSFKEICIKGCNPPTILWAGDLDTDGKLDLLIEEGNHYNVRLPTLYLSSMVKGDKIVEKAAWLGTVGD